MAFSDDYEPGLFISADCYLISTSLTERYMQQQNLTQ